MGCHQRYCTVQTGNQTLWKAPTRWSCLLGYDILIVEEGSIMIMTCQSRETHVEVMEL